MKEGICNHPDAEELMLELALELETVKGKKSYGYLPKPQKKLVDRIVDEMERLPSVRKCYEQWQTLQGKVDAYYHDKEQKRVPLSQQKEFQSIKNAVIKEAENIRKQAEDKAKQMVSREEIFLVAKRRANDLIMASEAKSKELRKVSNDYVEDSLRKTEEALAQTLIELRQARSKFRSAAAQSPVVPAAAAAETAEQAE